MFLVCDRVMSFRARESVVGRGGAQTPRFFACGLRMTPSWVMHSGWQGVWCPPSRRLTHTWRFVVALGIVALLLALAPTTPAAAHPLGNFSVNQYSRLEIGTTEARLVYVLDLAELPTVADRALLDTRWGRRDHRRRARVVPRWQALRDRARAPPLRWLDRARPATHFAVAVARARSGRARHDPHRSHLRRRASGDRGRRGTSSPSATTTRATGSAGGRSSSPTAPTSASTSQQRSPSTNQTRCASIPTTSSPARSTSGP